MCSAIVQYQLAVLIVALFPVLMLRNLTQEVSHNLITAVVMPVAVRLLQPARQYIFIA